MANETNFWEKVIPLDDGSLVRLPTTKEVTEVFEKNGTSNWLNDFVIAGGLSDTGDLQRYKIWTADNKIGSQTRGVALRLDLNLSKAEKNNLEIDPDNTIHIGEYPGEIAKEDEANQLEEIWIKTNSNGSAYTVFDYAPHLTPVIELNGNRYIRVKTKEGFYRNYSNGQRAEKDTFVWMKVAPIRCKILNDPKEENIQLLTYPLITTERTPTIEMINRLLQEALEPQEEIKEFRQPPMPYEYNLRMLPNLERIILPQEEVEVDNHIFKTRD